MSYIYLAQPYSDPDPAIMERRYLDGCAATAHLLNAGKHVYAPIVHCHELAKLYDLPRDFAFWRKYNYTMLAPASKILVLQLPGWIDSVGVTAEVSFADEHGIDKSYTTPEELLI